MDSQAALIDMVKTLVRICVEEYGEPDEASTVVSHAEVREARELIAALGADRENLKIPEKMTRQELVEFIAGCAGDLDIADRRMTLEGIKTNARELCEVMRALAHDESEGPIWISGD